MPPKKSLTDSITKSLVGRGRPKKTPEDKTTSGPSGLEKHLKTISDRLENIERSQPAPKKPRAKRAPLSEEKKQELRERLTKAREVRASNKAQAKLQAPE